ncbi:MAG: hypothetical protein IJK26_09855 [Clostridia bacterium]|nr:hypothetical protein [Clostridia bacterium]
MSTKSVISITINGEEIKHQIGDNMYSIEFDKKKFSLCVKELPYDIDRIEITSDGIRYYDDEGILRDSTNSRDRNNCGNNCELYFWSKQEAEEWLKSHLPEKQTFKKVDEKAFIIRDGCLVLARTSDMRIVDGKIGYGAYYIKDGVCRYAGFFTEEDIGKTVFFTYEEAKNVRDEIERRCCAE